ncbi:MAG: hypothetical protein WC849_01240 [Candidatus Paceibacterota bacterium]
MFTHELQSGILVIVIFCLFFQITGIYWIFSKKNKLQNGLEDNLISDNFEELPMISIAIGFISGIMLVSVILYSFYPGILAIKTTDISTFLMCVMLIMYGCGIFFMTCTSWGIFRFFIEQIFPEADVASWDSITI